MLQPHVRDSESTTNLFVIPTHTQTCSTFGMFQTPNLLQTCSTFRKIEIPHQTKTHQTLGIVPSVTLTHTGASGVRSSIRSFSECRQKY